MDFLERSGYRRIVLPGDGMRLRNINTPDELAGPPA
jgi:molybdopterin-guanine dinucleotide biosynthesis protein A